MNCASLLRKLPDEWHHKLRELPIIHSLINKGYSLEQCLTERSAIEQLYDALDPMEKTTLKCIIAKIGNRPFKQQDVVTAASDENGISSAYVLAGFIKLRQKAILFAHVMTWGETKYMFPEDSFSHWHRIVMKTEKRNGHDVAAISSTDGDVRTTLLYNVFHFLLLLTRSKLEKTKLGMWNKRQRDAFENACTLDCKRLKRVAAPEDSLSLLLEAADYCGLVTVKRHGAEPDIGRIERWLKQEHSALQHQLYTYWRQRHLTDERLLMHFIYWCEAQNDLFCIDDFKKWAKRNHIGKKPSGGCEDSFQSVMSDWLDAVASLGWMQQGEGTGGSIYYRYLLDQPTTEIPELFVQPDFEIIVPASAPLYVRWSIEQLAERKQEDTVIRFELTKQGARQAFENGLTVDQWISFIRPYAKNGIPDHVIQTLQAWENDWGRYRIEEAVLLHCADEQSADELCSIDALKPFIRKIGPRHCLVDKQKKSQFLKSLEKCGYYALNENNEPAAHLTKNIESGIRHNADESFELEPPCAQTLRIDPRYPELRDIYPGLHEIPAMWLNEVRSYHPSTTKAMIQKALEWRAQLKCEQDGTEFVFTPEKLQDGDRRRWGVSGRKQNGEKQLVDVSELDKLQLILPGVNDR